MAAVERQPAKLPGRSGNGYLAVRLHRRGDVAVRADDRRAGLHHDYRQGLPATHDRHARLAPGAVCDLPDLRPAGRDPAADRPDHDVAVEVQHHGCQRHGLDVHQLPAGVRHGLDDWRPAEQPGPGVRHGLDRGDLHGDHHLDHLPLGRAGPDAAGIRGDVPAVGAAAGVLARAVVGLDRDADRDLRNDLAAAGGLPDDFPAAGRPLDFGCGAAAGEER